MLLPMNVRLADQEIRRRNVMMNGLEASRRLLEKASASDGAKLREAIESLSTASLQRFKLPPRVM